MFSSSQKQEITPKVQTGMDIGEMYSKFMKNRVYITQQYHMGVHDFAEFLMKEQNATQQKRAADDADVEPYYDPDLSEEVAEHLEWQRTHRR